MNYSLFIFTKSRGDAYMLSFQCNNYLLLLQLCKLFRRLCHLLFVQYYVHDDPHGLAPGVIEPFFPQSVFPPEKWLGGKTTIGALQSQFSPSEKWLYSRISPRKNGYIVGFPPGRMAIQQDSPRKNDYIVVPL